MKICTFTQTYSNNRGILFEFHDLDKTDTDFRNNFDSNLYSFHNSSDDFFDVVKNSSYFNRIRNLRTVRFDGISYTETWRRVLEELLQLGFQKIMFLQDDVFSGGRVKWDGDLNYDIINYSPLVDFIKNGDYKMLNIEHNVETWSVLDAPVVYENGDLKVYGTSSTDFEKAGFYAFDDGPYVADIRYLIERVYDQNYYRIGDVWNGEGYTNQKIKMNPIERFTVNIPVYHRSRLIGINAWGKEDEMKAHIKMFGNPNGF